jgi:hypothetical protein
VRSEVLPSVSINITVFWDVTPTKLHDVTFQDCDMNIHSCDNLKSRMLCDLDLVYFISSL